MRLCRVPECLIEFMSLVHNVTGKCPATPLCPFLPSGSPCSPCEKHDKCPWTVTTSQYQRVRSFLRLAPPCPARNANRESAKTKKPVPACPFLPWSAPALPCPRYKKRASASVSVPPVVCPRFALPKMRQWSERESQKANAERKFWAGATSWWRCRL